MIHTPNADDARWLIDQRVDGLLWVPAASGERAQLAELLSQGIAIAGDDSPFEAADRLAYRALLAAPEAAPALWAASAAALKAALSGDPARDRGYLTDLADALVGAGDLSGALAVLADAATAFPDDPTWSLAAARHLVDADRPADALAEAERGMALAWGDNRLRVATVKARALVALGRADEARAFAAELLAAEPPPADGLAVRTARYRAALEAAVAP
jgi:hypothetical protein